MTDKMPARAKVQDALILCIGNRARNAGIATKVSDIRSDVFNMLNVDPNVFAAQNHGGITRNPAVKALTSAYYLLKKDGLTADAGRGKYALTDSGFRKFQSLSGGEVTAIPTPTVTIEEPRAPKAKAPKAAQSTARVTVMAGGATLDTPHVGKFDAHLIQLQKANSPCFGVAYSNSSKVCNRCPIMGSCTRKRMSGLANLARIVKQGVENGNLGVLLGLVEPEPIPEPIPEPVQTVEVNADDYITIPVEVDDFTCDCCKQNITKGTDAYMIPNYGTVHQHCVGTAVASMGGN